MDRFKCFFYFFKWIDPTLLVTKSISNRGSLKIFLLSSLLTDEVIEDKTFFKIRSEIKGLCFLFVLGFYFPGQCICGYWHLWQFIFDSQHSNTSLSPKWVFPISSSRGPSSNIILNPWSKVLTWNHWKKNNPIGFFFGSFSEGLPLGP